MDPFHINVFEEGMLSIIDSTTESNGDKDEIWIDSIN